MDEEGASCKSMVKMKDGKDFCLLFLPVTVKVSKQPESIIEKVSLKELLSKAGFTHANFVGRFLKNSKQTQAKNRFNAMTSPILKNL